MPRSVKRAALTSSLAPSVPAGLRLEPVVVAQSEALASLMFEAYQGSVDQDAQTPEAAALDVKQTFAGEFGAMIEPACVGLWSGPQLVSAAIVTRWKAAPLLAFVMTRPQLRGTGLGRLVLETAMAKLHALGEHELILVVTPTNTSAVKLYDRLGFQDTDPKRVRAEPTHVPVV